MRIFLGESCLDLVCVIGQFLVHSAYCSAKGLVQNTIKDLLLYHRRQILRAH